MLASKGNAAKLALRFGLATTFVPIEAVTAANALAVMAVKALATETAARFLASGFIMMVQYLSFTSCGLPKSAI
jgi:hypothetical protein